MGIVGYTVIDDAAEFVFVSSYGSVRIKGKFGTSGVVIIGKLLCGNLEIEMVGETEGLVGGPIYHDCEDISDCVMSEFMDELGIEWNAEPLQ